MPGRALAIPHKTEVPGFDSLWDAWKFSGDLVLMTAFDNTGVHSACNRNECQGIC